MTAVRVPPGWELPERLATPESVYLDRRQLVAALGLGCVAGSLATACAAAEPRDPATPARGLTEPALGERYADRFPAPRNEAWGIGELSLTPEETAARYNNFYEFTTAKERVWELASRYPLGDWRIEIGGRVKKERTLDLDDLMTRYPLEERRYRFRCVERWAMQVPWTGFPLRRLIDDCEPLGDARYVRFVTIEDREQMPGIAGQPWYPWPYFEGLRLDEARHELAFVAVGIYGHALPMQHGAPWRLALPWKYGYKGPKSVVRIELTRRQPETFWNKTTPNEYGFYSNIDPGRPHPRWSQAEERDIGTGETRPTLLYGGYAAEVAALYDGKEF
jgi:sulfoxide reductase catalytic subunit YedY